MEDWQGLLDARALRENVDGEALLWATKLLCEHHAKTNILIVLSDGAPVDYSTLAANGPSFLERHLQGVISDIEGDKAIKFGAIGIGCDVGRYYQTSERTEHPKEFPKAIHGLLDRLISPDLQTSAEKAE